MNVVLVGYRAAGKSTLGRLVAERLGWPYLDIDRGIDEYSGKTIKALYEEDGDTAYRDVESQVVAEMCAQDERVIAFGAGSLIRKSNREHARRGSLIFYLKVSPEVLWERICADPGSEETRPKLSSGGLAEVVEMLAQRAPVYRECANEVLDGTQPPEQLADRVAAALRGRYA
ncbi:MAG: shikimate kinase [Candidatus Latescibacterota bacterium]|nr:shikimate kinase [Candidatus Latescibacterota bacterium]